MIKIAPNTAIMIYLAITLSTILGVWFYHHLKQRRTKVVVSDQQLMICEYCTCAYTGDISKDVSQCPECKSFNKNNKYS